MSGQGGVTIVTSPTMFAGKSDRGEYLTRRAEVAGKRVFRLSHVIDMRTKDTATTSLRHSGFLTQNVFKTAALGPDIDGMLDEVDFVWIDEAQFFGTDLISAVRRWAKAGKEVVVTGLHLNYLGEKWGHVIDLAENMPLRAIEYLHAYCTRCHAPESAMHCPRIVRGDGDVLVGGKETYAALCGQCFIHYQREQSESSARETV